jgi:hypothetical protein
MDWTSWYERLRAWSLRWRLGRIAAVGIVLTALVGVAFANPSWWKREWQRTDFTKHSVELHEITSGGPSKDGIPSIDAPSFVAVADVDDLGENEPVIAVSINGENRAYPLRILMWHEIVNDSVGGIPITITYCPLCNSSIVFDRRVRGQVLDFGTTGKLRNSDLVMYDRQTESWWQQFIGEAIVGEMTGEKLTMFPSRVESFARYRKRFPESKVLVPNNANIRDYGTNPYVGYDVRSRPYPMFTGDLPDDIEPMVRVIAVEGEAWSLPLLREKGTITAGDLILGWEEGLNSALHSNVIAEGRDVGNVVVQRRRGDVLDDVVHDVTFAFVFNAFFPDGVIHQ